MLPVLDDFNHDGVIHPGTGSHLGGAASWIDGLRITGSGPILVIHPSTGAAIAGSGMPDSKPQPTPPGFHPRTLQPIAGAGIVIGPLKIEEPQAVGAVVSGKSTIGLPSIAPMWGGKLTGNTFLYLVGVLAIAASLYFGFFRK